MTKLEVCKKLKDSTKKILLFDGDNLICSGSGVVIREDGSLFTANHVIYQYPKLSNPKILALSASGAPSSIVEYKLNLFGVSFDIGMPNFVKPLSIDLAILSPIEKMSGIPYIEMENNVGIEGTDVLMAGFPDEITPPLNFNKMLDFNNSDLMQNKNQIETFFSGFMCLIMIKNGLIGGMQKINLKGKSSIAGIENINTSGAVYWIDNGSNHGASGGPVVDYNGNLLGIICEKGLTNQNIAKDFRIKVPSGATMALSHHLITWGLK